MGGTAAMDSHRINRLIIRGHTGNEQLAFALRRHLRDSWDALLPELETGFDAVSHAGGWMHIPRLDLQLTLGDPSQVEAQLSGLLRVEVQRCFERLRKGEQLSGSHVFWREGPLESPGDAIALGASTVNGNAAERLLSARIGPVQSLQHYLLTGSLPWYSAAPDVDETALQELASSNLAALVAVCAKHSAPHAWHRLFGLLDTGSMAQLEWVVGAIGATDGHGDGALAKKVLDLLLNSGELQASRHQRLWLASAVFATQAKAALGAPGSSGAHVPDHLKISGDEWRRLTGELEESARKKAFLDMLGSVLARSGDSGSRLDRSPARALREAAADLVAEARNGLDGNAVSSASEAVIPVHFAGAVLLHPYLPRLFKARGIELNAGKVPLTLLERAAALLSFAITGEDSAAEYQLGCVKLLLGVAMDTPLPLGGGLLNAADRLEARQMLGSLIGHWAALKGTTIDGLRTAFLQRAGFVRQTEEEVRLHIDRLGMDVLIDRIPYSISVVKLPWMPRPIYIEW